VAEVKRILAVADMIHPYIYRDTFPKGLEPLDLVLCAGDLPGYYIEFLATKVTCPVVWVPGNHGEEKVKDYLGNFTPPGGAINAHGKIVRAAGLTIVGWGGAPRYNDAAEGQYTGFQAGVALRRLEPGLWWQRARGGRGVDIFLTHAPPPGPHAGTDHAHRPCKQIGKFMERHRPPLLVHGHVHNYEGRRVEYTADNGTRVVNAYGYVMLELPV
jgi:Icc-related predicted phosphoesterase